MKIRGLKCLKCNDIIYSISRHDFKWCGCHSIFIDGGFDYQRFGGEPSLIEFVEIDVDTTK